MIDTYNLVRVDFDIEGAATADRASIDRRPGPGGIAAGRRGRGEAAPDLVHLAVLPAA